jgi:hypothetical protein
MSEPTTVASGLSYWSEEPSKYDHIEHPTNGYEREQARLIERLKHPDLKINSATDVTVRILKGILPTIIAEWSPTTIEFVNYNGWQYSPDEKRMLRGVIIRNGEGSVLLYAYGIGLSDTMSEMHRMAIFDAFNIPKDDRKRIIDCVWTKLDYAVVITLP